MIGWLTSSQSFRCDRQSNLVSKTIYIYIYIIKGFNSFDYSLCCREIKSSWCPNTELWDIVLRIDIGASPTICYPHSVRIRETRVGDYGGDTRHNFHTIIHSIRFSFQHCRASSARVQHGASGHDILLLLMWGVQPQTFDTARWPDTYRDAKSDGFGLRNGKHV